MRRRVDQPEAVYAARVASPVVSVVSYAAVLFLTLCGCSSSSPASPGDSGDDEASDAGGASPEASTSTGVDAGALPANVWSWLPVDGTRCADGSSTGMGLNVHPGATKVVIYLEGGGACYDGATCWQSSTATNITGGYGQKQFDDDITLQAGFLVRQSTLDVFADATLVYVPYCTGDLHLGNGVAMYNVGGATMATYHYGGHNVDQDLAVLARLYPALDRVFLSGSSAGGYGSVGNQDAVARALKTRVDVIDDSGPAVSLAYGGSTTLPASWSPRLPPGCTTCDSGAGLFAYDRATYPTSRYGFLTFATDIVLPEFYGVTALSFAGTLATYEAQVAADPNARYFAVQAPGHVVLAGHARHRGQRRAAAVAHGDGRRRRHRLDQRDALTRQASGPRGTRSAGRSAPAGSAPSP